MPLFSCITVLYITVVERYRDGACVPLVFPSLAIPLHLDYFWLHRMHHQRIIGAKKRHYMLPS